MIFNNLLLFYHCIIPHLLCCHSKTPHFLWWCFVGGHLVCVFWNIYVNHSVIFNANLLSRREDLQVYPQFISSAKFVLFKGIIFSDSNNIFLWHESEDINKKSFFPKFQLIPILRFQVMHNYVCFSAPINYCVA